MGSLGIGREAQVRQVGGGAAMECVSVQQPEAKASQGGEDQQGQGWRGPGRWAVAVVLAAAGGVVGQPQLVVGFVEALLTGLFCCATAKVGENPHLTWGLRVGSGVS